MNYAKLKDFALCDVYGRLIRILHSMATQKNGCLLIEEKVTQKELASRVGASQKTIARILKDLSSGGYIKYDKKLISIC